MATRLSALLRGAWFLDVIGDSVSCSDLRPRWAAPCLPAIPVSPTLLSEGEPSHNFKHSLRTVARHLKGLLLRQAALVGESLNRIPGCIAGCRQRRRPGRSYPRRSRKPVGKWACKAEQAATSA